MSHSDRAEIDFADKFKRLAERFHRIDADNAADGARYLLNAKASAATVVKKCCKAGKWDCGDIEWPKRTKRFVDESYEAMMALAWDAVCLFLEGVYQDELPTNICLMRNGFGSHKHWKQRAENSAEVCRLLARLVADNGPVDGGETADEEQGRWLAGELRDLANLTATPFRNYVRKAGFDTPGQGKKNHRYTDTQARKILECVRNNCSEKRIKSRCSEALKEHFKTTS